MPSQHALQFQLTAVRMRKLAGTADTWQTSRLHLGTAVQSVILQISVVKQKRTSTVAGSGKGVRPIITRK